MSAMTAAAAAKAGLAPDVLQGGAIRPEEVPIYGGPFRGVPQVQRGVRGLVRGEDLAGSASDVLRGAMATAEPALPAVVSAAPLRAVMGIGAATLASGAAEQAGRASGLSEGASRLTGDVAGVVAGGVAAGKGPAALDSVLRRVEAAPSVWEMPGAVWRGARDAMNAVERARLAAMVSNWGTAARNAVGQAGLFTLRAVEDAMHGVIQTARGEPARQAWALLGQDALAVGRRLTAEGRRQTGKLLEMLPEQADKLLESPIADLPLQGRISRALTFFNRVQETQFRKLAMDAVVRGELQRRGYDVSGAPERWNVPRDVLGEVAEQGVREALKLTLAKNPEGKVGSAILNAFEQFPPLRLIVPFPRFAMNSLEFMYEHSPVMFLSPKVWKSLAAGETRPMSKAMTGLAALGMAASYRLAPGAPQEWWKVRVGEDKYLDARSYAPFSAFLFAGEVLKDAQRVANGWRTELRPADYATFAASQNRLPASLQLFDAVMDGKDGEEKQRLAMQVAGQYVGSFLTPLSQVKSVVAEFVPSERVLRDTSESFAGTALRPVPFAGEALGLPVLPSVTRPGPVTVENPLRGELTGVRLQSVTPTERELERLRISPWPARTGSRAADREARGLVGSVLEREVSALMVEPRYQRAPFWLQREVMGKVVLRIKQAARKRAMNATTGVRQEF